uniref:KH domain-containing protein n=1 Tax=Haemonchus placei TaxID=6290 RepID=A0A0N4W5B0_HAEPC
LRQDAYLGPGLRSIPRKSVTEATRCGRIARISLVPTQRCSIQMSSFPLYVETYKIGNRVYRRTAYKRNDSKRAEDVGDTPDVYADEYDDEDPSCSDVIPAKRGRQLSGDDEEPADPALKLCDSDPRVSYDGSKYTAEIYVPSAFYGKLIGTRGTTRRELEESTECRLTIPRKGQKGNVEIKSFVGLENVQRCLDRIEFLVAEARKTAPLTHFVAVPCAQSEIVQSFELFKEAVINNPRVPEESRKAELFTSPIKMHITVCVLWLFDEEEQKKAIDVINECRGDLLAHLPSTPLEIEVSGVETWEDDPKNVRVLFSVIRSDPLQRICDLLRKRLVIAGLSPKTEKSLSTIESSVRMHVTLMKSLYADRDHPKPFDAEVILEEYKDYHFGTFTPNKIVVCSINTVVEETGFYEQLYEMALQ